MAGMWRKRVGRQLQRAREWMMEYAYLVTLSAVIAVIAASAMYTERVKRAQEGGVQAAAGAPETQETASAVPAAEATPLPTIAPLTVRYTEIRPGGGTVRPLSGKVLRAYDVHTPVYWPALSCVQVHAALDIAGEAGESVLCCMDGTVQRTARDDLWGWRVWVKQTDGREAVYAGLERLDVEAEQNVTRGQALGVLMAAIPCEAELGAHVHLELSEDGALRDPAQMLP